MAQLIKLQDYVSRYEQNIFLYPSRYVRLKKHQWEKVQRQWEENGQGMSENNENSNVPEWLEEEEKQRFITKVKGILKFGRKDTEAPEDESERDMENDETEESNVFQFSPIFSNRPDSIAELKQQFLDQLFRFQMKWASSTLTEKSFIDKRYYFDEQLKYLLQRFPDTFLVLHNPIFLLKKAPVEVESIVITPTEAWCITFLEGEDRAVFTGSKERFWTKKNQSEEKKVLNPLLTLNRTEKIIEKIFGMYEIDLPIHKVVLCRDGYVDYPSVPYDTKIIERRNYEKWFQSMRANRSPLKHNQLKGAQSLLQYCQTTSIRRLEWDANIDLEITEE